MQTSNRLVIFMYKHRIILIGFVLYLIAYLLNNIFPPFLDYGSGNPIASWEKNLAKDGFLDAYFPRLLEGNRFAGMLPLDILYFGVADVAAAAYNGIFMPLALITYFSYLLQKILQKIYEPGFGKVKKTVIAYFYSNAMFYPLCFLMMFLQNISGNVLDIAESIFTSTGDNIVIKIIVAVIFVLVVVIGLVFLLVPMVVNMLYFFGYLLVFDVFAAIIEALDMSVFGSFLEHGSFLQELLAYLSAFAIILIGNLLLEKVLEFCQKISILPARKIVKKIAAVHS